MPASLRAHPPRVKSSRPYDRRSPSAGSAQSETTYLSRSAPPASSIQATDLGADAIQNPEADTDALPDRPGLPTYAEYKRIEAAYLHSLSPRKRDKALITQAMFDKIWDVLHQPEACTIDTPQFRFWVRKMFTLSRDVGGAGIDGCLDWNGAETGRTAAPAGSLPDADADFELERSLGIGPGIGRATADELGFIAVVLHENRPVAIMEQLYELFCYCHVRAGHGGRDKTCAVIREHYSWVPKELTAQFVKACPTCVLKRSGQAHVGVGGVGVDLGVVAHRRVVGGRKRRSRATPLEVGAEGPPTPVEPPGLGWPTTEGPLDPGNPKPCGVHEREQEREWFRMHGNVGIVCPSSPLSPALGSRTLSEGPSENWEASGWSSVPRALTLDAPPPFLCDTTRPLDHSFPVKCIREEKENCSPAKTELPSLVSALSNESLDDYVSLAERAPGDAAECLLPPPLQPLRLLGPVSSDIESSYPFQIDPVLLSFDYPGLDHSPFAFHAGGDGDPSTEEHGITSVYHLRSPLDDLMDLPMLDPSRKSDSPDSSFERTAACTTVDGAAAATALPFSLSAEFMTRSRCGSRYGYRDGLLATPSPYPTDEVGQEFDGSLSFRS